MRECWTQKFLKRENISSEKKFLAYFLSRYWVWQTSADNLWGSTRYCDNYCGSYEVISLGPKRLLKTKGFWKKGNLSGEKNFWPTFSRIIGCDKANGTIYEGPKGFLTNTVDVIRSFSQDLRFCWKQIFWKKGNLSSDKKILVFFLALSSVINLKRQYMRVPKIFWRLLWKF